MLGIIILGIVLTGYQDWFGELVSSAEKEILVFQAVAVRVAEEKEKFPNENRKNQLLKSVNIDTTNKAHMMTIPGIGSVTAERILLHREDHG